MDKRIKRNEEKETTNIVIEEMKKALKIIGITLFAIGAGATAIAVYVNMNFPKVSVPSELTIEGTPEQIKRGDYLANNVLNCIDCHSKRNFEIFGGPIVPGTEGQGGESFGEELGLPGTLYSKNITPFALNEWTDGEVYRLITTGVRKNGEPVFPFMPYQNYSKMDTEDIKSVIAYIRTLKPIVQVAPESSVKFPVNLIMRTFPHDVSPVQKPDVKDQIKYGQYLVDIAVCQNCHTPMEKGQFNMELYLSGGNEFLISRQGTVRSSNITSDKATGIGSWSKEQFVARFKNPEMPHNKNITLRPGEFQTMMPWTNYAKMDEKDLEAIYEYLMTVKPVSNQVVRFSSSD